MAIEITYSAIFGSAHRLHASLETGRLPLGAPLGRAQDLLTHQATLTAAKLKTTSSPLSVCLGWPLLSS
jgi:hypothetical protein